jgi:hypothetical protein
MESDSEVSTQTIESIVKVKKNKSENVLLQKKKKRTIKILKL